MATTRSIGLRPIWLDTYANLGSDAIAPYTIEADGVVIYAGTAYARPGEDEAVVCINKVCADYLSTRFPAVDSPTFDNTMVCPTFTVKDKDGNEVLEVQFANDWSYDPMHNVNVASAPIDGVVDVRMPLLWSVYSADSVSATLTFADGTTQTLPIGVGSVSEFNASFNLDFVRQVFRTTAGTLVFDPSAYEGLVGVTINGDTYKVENTCQRYALYYLNEYGGWDGLLIGSTDTKTDSYTRSEYKRLENTNHPEERGRTTYLNEIKRSWRLDTGILTDAQSMRMRHLLGSTSVYLYDLDNATMVPVIIADSSMTYQTVKNNGRSFPKYTINVELATTRIRR